MNNNQSLSGSSGDTFLTFRAYGGPELGPGVHERETILRLSGDRLFAELEAHRSESDAENEPIGIFKMALGQADMDRVWRLADSVGLRNLPGPSGSQFGATIFEITVKKSETSFTQQIISSDINSVNQAGPLLDELYRLVGETRQHPVSAIRVSVAPADGDRFRVAIINAGTSSVYIIDPRLLGRDEDDHNWAGVRIAQLPDEVAGQTSPPLEWDRVYLDLPPGGAGPGLILINPGEERSWPTEKWDPEVKGVRYLVQGVFSSYGASEAATSAVLMRGAIFSEAIEVTAK